MAMSAMQRRWTADSVRELSRDDDAWPRYELIDGELVVTPAPRDAHPKFAAHRPHSETRFVSR